MKGKVAKHSPKTSINFDDFSLIDEVAETHETQCEFALYEFQS